MDSGYSIRIGFVPSQRFAWSTEWALSMRERVCRVLAGTPGLDLVVPGDEITPNGLVQNDDQAEKVIAYFRDQGVDGVIIGAMDFADEISAATIAAAIHGPVLLFGTKEGPLRSAGERSSDSFCGTISIATALRRRQLPFAFAGIVFPEEEAFKQEVKDFVGACAATNAFLGARVGQVGVRPERFETVACDEVALLGEFSQRIVPCELADVIIASNAIPSDDPRLAQTVEVTRTSANVVNVNDNFMDKSARLELALADLYRRRQFSCMSLQCWPSMKSQLGIRPCTVLGNLCDQGIMVACEADNLGALDMIAQYNAALRVTVPHFIDWTVQHNTRPNTLLAWHCGNGPVSLRDETIDVVLRNRFRALDAPIPENDVEAGAREFAIKPGQVTLSRLVDCDGEFKMLITKGQIVRDRDVQRGTWAWVEVADLDKLYRTIVDEGFIHHASMIHGDFLHTLELFCKFVGIRTVIV